MPAPDHPTRANRRLGLWLFAIYLVLYLGFVFWSAFFASSLERPVFAGLNLAIVYGAGLIVAALILSLLYELLCKPTPDEEESSAEADQ